MDHPPLACTPPRSDAPIAPEPRSIDERQLVSLCCQHNRTAERELYARFAPRLRALCRRYMGGADDAEDLLQEVFVRIFTTLGSYRWRGEGSLWTWMRRIATNMAVDMLRSRPDIVWVTMEGALPAIEEPIAEEVDALPEETLLRFVAALPTGYRTVFNLVCIEGMSHKEAARLMGIAEKSSSSQLARARSLLAKNIKEYLRNEE